MTTLKSVYLTGPDLFCTGVDNKGFDQAKSLKGVTMLNGSIYPKGFRAFLRVALSMCLLYTHLIAFP